jgi:hypothetical protein
MGNMQYTLQVLEAYEVLGAAYFDGLALAYPQQSAFFERCAALERATASQLSALLRKYQLTPRAQTTLEERGTLDAPQGSRQRLEAADAAIHQVVCPVCDRIQGDRVVAASVS